MEKVKSWDPKMSVGSTIIDNQHKVLIDLVNDLNNAIRTGENMRVLDALMGVLQNYAFQHFETEEKYFQHHHDAIKHCLEHYQLLKKLNTFIVDFKNNRPPADKTAQDFLAGWLHEHIDQYDRPFFDHETVEMHLMKESDEADDFESDIKDRRHHKRIQHNAVVDGDIRVHCYNATRLKGGVANIIDMSTGGLMLRSNGHHDIDDLLIVSCSIGSSFKMKEKMKVKTAKDDLYGVGFISPSQGTVDFFTKLYGSVHLSHHNPI